MVSARYFYAILWTLLLASFSYTELWVSGLFVPDEKSLLISFIGIGAVLLGLTVANKFYKRTLINVDLVDAGTNDDHIPFHSDVCSFKISPFFETFYHNGKKVNPKDYLLKKVDGDCMIPRNIYAGDLLFIENFNGKSDSLSIGDIIFIKYESKKHSGYKIREYRGLDADNNQKLHTLYYQRDGNAKRSSHLHELTNVKGVVKMKFTI